MIRNAHLAARVSAAAGTVAAATGLVAALLAGAAVGGIAPASAQDAACEDFQFFEYAQSVFEADPAAWINLDPDGDGIACPDLPGGVAPALWTDRVPAGAAATSLVRVVDGDTIVVDTPAGEDTVRIIMTDTPETRSPQDPVECFGPEATAYTAWLLEQDATIYLESDITERDRYGRLLRYVWIDFGGGFVVLLNEAIARSGHGLMVTYPPDVRYADQIRAAQAFAQRHGRGLWSACGSAGGAFGIAAPTPPPTGGGDDRSGRCDPSYPDLCLPSSPDLDCDDIPDRRFRVLPPDPHVFDGNRDGLGCERD